MRIHLTALLLASALVPCALSQTSSQVRQAQQFLKDKGYYTDKVDGISGPNTRSAISAYQRDRGLVVNGRLDQATFADMKPGGVSAASSSATSSVKQSAGEASREATNAVTGKSGAVPAATKSVSGASGSATEAVKKAGSDASKEAGNAVGAIKNVFGGGSSKKEPAPTK